MLIIKMHSELTIRGSEVWQGVVTLLLSHDVRHHVDVVRERRDAQPLDDDVGQVVGVHHQVVLAVLHQVLIVTPLILPYRPNCRTAKSFNFIM